jgi:hypothetical protein
MKIPAIFGKTPLRFNKALAPPVMFEVDALRLPSFTEYAATGADSVPLTFFAHFWLELCEGSKHMIGTDNKLDIRYEGDGIAAITSWTCRTYMPDGLPYEMLPFINGDYERQGASDELQARGSVAVALLKTLYLVHQVYDQAAADKPKLPASPTMWVNPPDVGALRIAAERVGDTVRYVPLTQETYTRTRDEMHSDEPAYRKREHDVRGHWRTYRSGRRVWVREHTRGDASLGRVTRVITI